MVEQILIMYQAGTSKRKIARSLGISRNTVDRYIARGGSQQRKLSSGRSWFDDLNWDLLTLERKKGASVKTLFEEHNPQIDYSTFAKCPLRLSEPYLWQLLDPPFGERQRPWSRKLLLGHDDFASFVRYDPPLSLTY